MKKLSILGSTGSIGEQTLSIVENFSDRFQVVALGAGRNIDLLRKQITQFRPRIVSVLTEELARALSGQLHDPPEIVHGIEGLIQIATLEEVDMVVSALVGAIGLVPTLSAIKARKQIALANKESLVMGGKIVMEEARRERVDILPVDSEHCAIFQSMVGHSKKDVHRIILTASGGPFLHYPIEKLRDVLPAEALKHPRWKMGRKVTIDSATLMNKGLELIEARWLFDLEPSQLGILIHPQSIVHSLVELKDGSVLAQLSPTDMKIPIQYALTYPERENTRLPSLGLSQIKSLEFLDVEEEKFPLVRLAFRALKEGKSIPVALNAANEVVVEAFLKREIKFSEISVLVSEAVDNHQKREVKSLEDILEVDSDTRVQTRNIMKKRL